MSGMGRVGAGRFLYMVVIKETAADVMFWLRPEVGEGTSDACIWGKSILGREGSKYRVPEAGACLVSGEPLSREVSKWSTS